MCVQSQMSSCLSYRQHEQVNQPLHDGFTQQQTKKSYYVKSCMEGNELRHGMLKPEPGTRKCSISY